MAVVIFSKIIDTGYYRNDLSQGLGSYQCSVELAGAYPVQLQYKTSGGSWVTNYAHEKVKYSLQYNLYVPSRGDLFGQQGVDSSQYGQQTFLSNKIYINLLLELINWEDIKYDLATNIVGTSDLTYRLYVTNFKWKLYRV
jgi:hypothetical protein